MLSLLRDFSASSIHYHPIFFFEGYEFNRIKYCELIKLREIFGSLFFLFHDR